MGQLTANGQNGEEVVGVHLEFFSVKVHIEIINGNYGA